MDMYPFDRRDRGGGGGGGRRMDSRRDKRVIVIDQVRLQTLSKCQWLLAQH